MKNFTKLEVIRTYAFVFSIVACILFITNASAQNSGCATDEYFKWQVSKNPAAMTDRLTFEKEMTDNFAKYKQSAAATTGLRIIPVVFHIIHNYGPENIPKQRVLDQVATMNKNYQKLNADTINVRPIFKSLIANCQIEFRLASKDPQGNWTDGIDRIASTLTYAGNDNVKALEIWDASKYLNIWVVQTINMNTGITLPPGYVVAGYSQFPTSNNPATDGIVVRSDQIVSGNTTLTHECGHSLNLYHPFETNAGGGAECGKDPRITGDHVDDTPAISGPSYGCNTSLNTCTLDTFDGGGDRPDMIEAFMDYSNCPHMFTNGQLIRINATLTKIAKRVNLISSTNMLATGIDSLSEATSKPAPKPDFYANTYEVCEGGMVNLLDNSFNATVTNYTWTIPGANPVAPSSVTSANPTFIFPTVGVYPVTLTVSNANGSNTITKKAFINVVSKYSTVKTIQEDFESGVPPTWTASQDSKGLGWALTTKAAVSGTHSYYLNNLVAQYDTVYTFTIPEFDMASGNDTILRFKYAFAQTTSTSSDIFRILLADDCSATPIKYSNVFTQSGVANVTAHTVHATDFVPAADEWKEAVINLGNYKTLDKMSLKFYLLNHHGNNFYIDDINMGNMSGIAPSINGLQELSIFPNPASDHFTMTYPATLNGAAVLEAYDISGKMLGALKLNASAGDAIQISKQSLNIYKDGVYYIKLSTANGIYNQKLIILQ